MANNESWNKIFDDYNIGNHDFDKSAFEISANQIKKSCQNFNKVNQKEVRILCKQDSRSDRPSVFIENNLFILPISNGNYAIVKGEGYIDIPIIDTSEKEYISSLEFNLETSKIGNSEMQHLDFAYASSLIRTYLDDPSLVLTIRGRKYTPEFSFKVNNIELKTRGVQTEVDAGYESKNQIVLIEAKNSNTIDTIIRQLFYPYKQWKVYTNKKVTLLFFEKRNEIINIWQYEFKDEYDYNSIELIKADRYKIIENF